jgi:outer membrane protein assembly factor BamD (BamD/ComL family)
MKGLAPALKIARCRAKCARSALIWLALTCARGARAEEPAPAQAESAPQVPAQAKAPSKAREDQGKKVLDGYLELMEKQRLLPPPAQGVDELSAIMEQAQSALAEGKHGEATNLLLDALEGPRFREFADFPPHRTATLMLASLLLEQHALKSAQRHVDLLLAQGRESEAFGPAYRLAVDIALARGDLAASARHIEQLTPGALSEDSKNELNYLQALAAYERGDLGNAFTTLKLVTKRSRFYASAQYLLGAIAAKSKNYKEAEARFCSIAGAGKDDAYSFYVDGRFFPVRDLAQLGLGRVAHETGRADDAFYYYFQVPNDSRRVSEALFEAAWASYEGDDHDAALDSLDQLRARYPRSPYSAEAAVLRGYVHLSRCEFSEAEKHLLDFEKNFAGVLREVDASLASPARRQTIYRDLVAREESIQRMEQRAEQGEPTPDSLLLAMVAADPEFYRLWSQIRALDEELSASGHVPDELYALSARVKSKDAPAPRLDDGEHGDEVARLRDGIAQAKSAVDAFSGELAQLGKTSADASELRALHEIKRKLDRRLDDLSHKLRELLAHSESASAAPSSSELSTRFLEDKAYVQSLRTRALALRAKLEEQANLAGERALTSLRERLAKELRRARIGRIDAVMGSKRQVELQVESLAAGRFPAELVDPLRMQSMLRDDEEYWPFEGEDWPDEFIERYAEEEEP